MGVLQSVLRQSGSIYFLRRTFFHLLKQKTTCNSLALLFASKSYSAQECLRMGTSGSDKVLITSRGCQGSFQGLEKKTFVFKLNIYALQLENENLFLRTSLES